MFEQMGAAPGGAGGNWWGRAAARHAGFDFSQMFGGAGGGAGFEGGGLDNYCGLPVGGHSPSTRFA